MLNFELTEEQQKKIALWDASCPKVYVGAIGGRLTYSFTPTGLGTIEQVHCAVCDQMLDVTEYDLW